MSEHHVVSIEVDDQEALVNALEEMGYKSEVHANNSGSVRGYMGRGETAKCSVIVRKESTHFYGDLGFERTSDNKFKMHIDSMDQRKFKTNQLKQLHAKHKIKNHIKAHAGKYSFASEKVDEQGKIHIKLRVRR